MPKKALRQKTKCVVCGKQFIILKNKKKTCGAKACKTKIKRAYDKAYIRKYYKEKQELLLKYMQAEKAVRDFLKRMEKQTKAKTGKDKRILITSNNFLVLKSLTQKIRFYYKILRKVHKKD